MFSFITPYLERNVLIEGFEDLAAMLSHALQTVSFRRASTAIGATLPKALRS